MKTTNETRRRVMKMAHVRRKVDMMIFGKIKSFAAYLSGAWATVKEEMAKADEEARIAEMRKTLVLPTAEECEQARLEWLLDYYTYIPGRRYYGD